MANFVFWNLNRKDLTQKLVLLCNEHEVDLLILAESVVPDEQLLLALNKSRKRKFLAPPNLSEKLRFFVRYPDNSITSVKDTQNIAIRRFTPRGGLELILVAVHLPSKMYKRNTDHTMLSARLSRDILETEENYGHKRTLVIGDFNMNPFETGVIAADGLHAVMDKKIAARESRVVDSETKPFFYNPMWSRLGDESKGPPGIYYYSTGGQENFFWNTFDQVLFRPALFKYYSDESLKIISRIGNIDLLSERCLNRTYSDHLPISISFQFERD